MGGWDTGGLIINKVSDTVGGIKKMMCNKTDKTDSIKKVQEIITVYKNTFINAVEAVRRQCGECGGIEHQHIHTEAMRHRTNFHRALGIRGITGVHRDVTVHTIWPEQKNKQSQLINFSLQSFII